MGSCRRQAYLVNIWFWPRGPELGGGRTARPGKRPVGDPPETRTRPACEGSSSCLENGVPAAFKRGDPSCSGAEVIPEPHQDPPET